MKMVVPVMKEHRLRYLLTWQDWNFTAALEKALPEMPDEDTARELLAIFQAYAHSHQDEVLFLPDKISRRIPLQPGAVGFEPHLPGELNYTAWQFAAQQASTSTGKQIWVKKIAQPIELKDNILNARE
jgi:hypothetical protein